MKTCTASGSAARTCRAPWISISSTRPSSARSTSERPEQIESRLGRAREELAARDEFPHVVVNDSLPRAVEELTGLVASIKAERTRSRTE